MRIVSVLLLTTVFACAFAVEDFGEIDAPFVQYLPSRFVFSDAGFPANAGGWPLVCIRFCFVCYFLGNNVTNAHPLLRIAVFSTRYALHF